MRYVLEFKYTLLSPVAQCTLGPNLVNTTGKPIFCKYQIGITNLIDSIQAIKKCLTYFFLFNFFLDI